MGVYHIQHAGKRMWRCYFSIHHTDYHFNVLPYTDKCSFFSIHLYVWNCMKKHHSSHHALFSLSESSPQWMDQNLACPCLSVTNERTKCSPCWKGGASSADSGHNQPLVLSDHTSLLGLITDTEWGGTEVEKQERGMCQMNTRNMKCVREAIYEHTPW